MPSGPGWPTATAPGQPRRAVAGDGKTRRGAARDDRHGHLVAAMDHATRTVLAQREVQGAPGEVPAFQPLLADLDLAGTVGTADALQTTQAPPSSSWSASRPTTCWSSRPTSLRCWPAAPGCPGTGSRSWLRRRGIRARSARRPVEPSVRLGRQRWKVERSLSWLSCFGRLLVRWGQDSGRWFAFVLVACAVVRCNQL
jgi:hypothetical protein